MGGVGAPYRRRRWRRRGKSLSPPGGGGPDDSAQVLEGDKAKEQLREEQRETTSRRKLEQSDGFEEMSPEVGELDIEATEHALSEDTDVALSLLADMANATDVTLRALAQQMAARVVLDLAATTGTTTRGIGRMRSLPMTEAGGDLDIEASMDALLSARASGTPPPVDELMARTWTRPDAAFVVLIDRSGSMTGDRVATAAVAAAAAAQRADTDYGIIAFSDKAIVVKAIGEPRPVEDVVNDVLRLRGFGPTDLSLALRTAAAQLSRSMASRRRVILLSDCRPTAGSEPELAAGGLEDVGILAPADDCEDAADLAMAIGARWAPLAGPTDVPAAFAAVSR